MSSPQNIRLSSRSLWPLFPSLPSLSCAGWDFFWKCCFRKQAMSITTRKMSTTSGWCKLFGELSRGWRAAHQGRCSCRWSAGVGWTQRECEGVGSDPEKKGCNPCMETRRTQTVRTTHRGASASSWRGRRWGGGCHSCPTLC